MEKRELGKTGLMVSPIGFGGAYIHTSGEKEAIETVREALKRGINFFDTSAYYGKRRSEEVFGKALKGIKRG